MYLSLYHNCTKAFIKHFDMKVTEVCINSAIVLLYMRERGEERERERERERESEREGGREGEEDVH